MTAQTSGGFDPDGDEVQFLYDWGDGTTGTNGAATQTHVYADTGNYKVQVKAIDSFGNESDWSQPLPLTIAGTTELTVTKLQVKLNFASANKDTCTLTATLSGTAGFSVANQSAKLKVADMSTQFDLNGKGQGKNGNSTLRFSYNKKNNLWTMQATFQRGEYKDACLDYGLENKTFKRPGQTVVMPIQVDVGGVRFVGQRTVKYTAQSNKSGLAK